MPFRVMVGMPSRFKGTGGHAAGRRWYSERMGLGTMGCSLRMDDVHHHGWESAWGQAFRPRCVKGTPSAEGRFLTGDIGSPDRPVAGAGQGMPGRVKGQIILTPALISNSCTAWARMKPARWKPGLGHARRQSLKRVFLLRSGTGGI